MGRIAGPKSFDPDEMVDIGPKHNDFRGIIQGVKYAPYDYGGSQFAEGGADYGLHQAGHVHFKYTDDNGEGVEFTEPLNCGALSYLISSNGTEDEKSLTSDIDYPGDPIAYDPDDPGTDYGIDEEAVQDKFEEIFGKCESRDEYRDELVKRYGGLYPFSIGRGNDLVKGTKWMQFCDKAKACMGKEYKGATSDEVFKGVEGQFVRLPPAERKGQKKEDKVTAKYILCMTAFYGRVDLDEVSKDKVSKGKGKGKDTTATSGTVQERLIQFINELSQKAIESDGEAVYDDVKKSFRSITINKSSSKFPEGPERAQAWKLVARDQGWISEQDNWDFEDGTLTVYEG